MSDAQAKPSRLARTSLLLIACLAILAVAVLLPSTNRKAYENGLDILCTFLPVYVFALNVVGDTPGVHVELLVDTNVGCPHSYSVRAQDLKRVARADLVVANGLGSEGFLAAMARDKPPDRIITISDDCEVLHTRVEPAAETPEEPDLGGGHPARPLHKDGGEGEPAQESDRHDSEQHIHGEVCDHGPDHQHAPGAVNPHVWVSPRQAARQVRTLAGKLARFDPPHAERYRANAEAYVARLEALQRRMEEAARRFTNRNIVTFHDAFEYLARDLGLNVVATLTVLPDDSLSASNMARIIETIKRTHAAAVFYEPAYSDRVARTVARDAGVPLLPLNPFNTIDGTPAAGSYEEVMNRNLQVLEQALTTAPATP